MTFFAASMNAEGKIEYELFAMMHYQSLEKRKLHAKYRQVVAPMRCQCSFVHERILISKSDKAVSSFGSELNCAGKLILKMSGGV